MRTLIVCSAFFLTACGAYTSVIGQYRGSVSPTDVRAIKQVAEQFRTERGMGGYNTLTLDCIARDRVFVYTVSQANSFYVDFAAIRRGGNWMRDRAAGSLHRHRSMTDRESMNRSNHAMERTPDRCTLRF
jgi:hypothetical protein